MKTLEKIIVYIATSADGYIARADGDGEWLNGRPRTIDLGMQAFYYSTIEFPRNGQRQGWNLSRNL
jgi:dihydrofolate reductase